ncbi:restriction endonuclease subunit S [Pseudomonas citronellolis]|uniref:Restriction endonuclease subunit S n=2 Tax=Pseudomonas citronellolis TaxID=53408 RepID=A0AAW6P2I9_9PSED|nr:restriction endonuclease subunit S [Pseudomonas citronellolis]MDF3841397.1 restriction endonuclease subunit S [Pseudomonas citronellolis]
MGSGSYVSIGELESLGAITAIQDGNHGNYHPKASEYTSSGIPFVMASDIKDGRVDLKGCSRLPKERTDRLRIGFAKSGDVLLTHKGTVGSVALAPNVPDYLMLTPQVTYYRTASDQLLPAYLAYAFREPGFQQQMISESAQSTRPYIGIQAQRRLRVRYVDIKNQHRIVSILSAYDDLIENNTRRIEILEEMARRLYEEWFVQFRFPGHEGVVFEDDVPQGWSRVRLDSVAEVNPEAISPKNAPDEIMYVDISSVSTRQVNKLQRLEFSEAPGRARRKVISGDVVWSCVRPALRSYALIIDPPPNTIVSTGFAVVRADSVPFSYLYQVLGSDQFVSYLDNHATGAAYPAVKASDFEAAEVVLPCKNLLAQFDGAVLPMLKMIHVLRLKNNNLQSQRDLLLPKLISGEIDVSDIPMPT